MCFLLASLVTLENILIASAEINAQPIAINERGKARLRDANRGYDRWFFIHL